MKNRLIYHLCLMVCALSLKGCALLSKPGFDSKFVKSANRKISREVKELSSCGLGSGGSVGIEHITLCFNSYLADPQDVQDAGMRAYALARESLKEGGELFDYTNHGPSSPNLPVIAIYNFDGVELNHSYVFNGKYVTKGNPVYKEKQGVELKELLERLSQPGVVPDGGEIYIHRLSQIEEDVPAIMLGIFLENSPIVTDTSKQIEFYKNLYPKLQKVIQEEYGENCFLGFKLAFGKDMLESLVWNIRNNLRTYARKRGDDNYPETETIVHEALNEWIPVNLHRKIK